MVLNKEFEKLFEESKVVAKKIQDARYNNGYFFPLDLFKNPGIFLPSAACCGIAELSGPGLLNAVYYITNVHTNLTGKTRQELQDLNAVYLIGMFCKTGLLFYCSPPGQYQHKFLTKLGFTKVVSFANPIHGMHEVEILMCQGPAVSKAVNEGRVSWWGDALDTNRAANAAHGTM